MNPDLKYLIGLLQLKGVGSSSIIKLLKHYGSAKKTFEHMPNDISKNMKGVSLPIKEAICGGPNWVEVEKELAFIERNEIQCITYHDENYPRRLKFCADAPVLLLPHHTFRKGSIPSQLHYHILHFLSGINHIPVYV